MVKEVNAKPSSCPFVYAAQTVKSQFFRAAQRVAAVYQDLAIQRQAMRKLGPNDYCQLQRCLRNQPFDPRQHQRCIEWVNDVLDPRQGPPD